MSELLPPNTTRLERALAEAEKRIERVPVSVREVWNPQTCPAHALPWLAWAFSVDDWDEDWGEQQQRDSIASALQVQQKKGTIGAVRDALAALGIDVRVQEWFNQIPAGDPYTFRLWLEARQTPVSQEGIQQALDIVERIKSLRSHLETVLVRASSAAPVYVASVTNLGSQITVSHFQPRGLVINARAVVVS